MCSSPNRATAYRRLYVSLCAWSKLRLQVGGTRQRGARAREGNLGLFKTSVLTECPGHFVPAVIYPQIQSSNFIYASHQPINNT